MDKPIITYEEVKSMEEKTKEILQKQLKLLSEYSHNELPENLPAVTIAMVEVTKLLEEKTSF